MNKDTEQYILRDVIKTFGERKQTDMAIEEMAELTKALMKHRRYPDDEQVRSNLVEEIEDVGIMLDQLRIMYGSDPAVREMKLCRTECMVLDERNRAKEEAFNE